MFKINHEFPLKKKKSIMNKSVIQKPQNEYVHVDVKNTSYCIGSQGRIIENLHCNQNLPIECARGIYNL